MYYNRARYYDQNTGRFNRMDPFAGNNRDPQSLHKYLYAHCNPIMNVDPTGQFTMINITVSIAILAVVSGLISGTIAHYTGGSFYKSFAFTTMAMAFGLTLEKNRV